MLEADQGALPYLTIVLGNEALNSQKYRCLMLTGGPPLSISSKAIKGSEISMLKADQGRPATLSITFGSDVNEAVYGSENIDA